MTAERAGVYRRRLRQVVLALYGAVLVGCVGLVLGPWLNDRSIAAHPGRALATVRDVSWLRTTADFQDGDGIYHSPPTGLLYPTGLGEGQQVWVTYDVENPNLVKVEGRQWTLSIIPALSVVAVASAIAGALWWAIGAWSRRAARKS